MVYEMDQEIKAVLTDVLEQSTDPPTIERVDWKTDHRDHGILTIYRLQR